MKFRHYLLILTGLCALLPAIRQAESCSVPVFRYALERWRPDPYKGIFIYRDAVSEKDQALLEKLETAARNAESPLNLIIRKVDVSTFSKNKLRDLLQGPIPDNLPILVIWYPDQMGKNPPIWAEKLTPSLVNGILQSPKRRQLAESLIKGDSVVWVFIPSGNRGKDEKALSVIRKELDDALAQFRKTPFSVLSGGARKQLSYGFPILTLSPDDPAERIFIETLLKSESDLYEYTDEPMVFPVFGRGRVLGCLFGEYITAQRINEATAFLAGACSCEVKGLNPGTDLLVAAPWDMVVMNAFVEDTPLPELTGVLPENTGTENEMTAAAEIPDPAGTPEPVAAATAQEELSTAGLVPEPERAPEGNTGILKIYGITLSSILAIVAFAGFILNHRRKKVS